MYISYFSMMYLSSLYMCLVPLYIFLLVHPSCDRIHALTIRLDIESLLILFLFCGYGKIHCSKQLKGGTGLSQLTFPEGSSPSRTRRCDSLRIRPDCHISWAVLEEREAPNSDLFSLMRLYLLNVSIPSQISLLPRD